MRGSFSFNANYHPTTEEAANSRIPQNAWSGTTSTSTSPVEQLLRTRSRLQFPKNNAPKLACSASWPCRPRCGGCRHQARLRYETLGRPASIALHTASWPCRPRCGGCRHQARLRYETLGRPAWTALHTASWPCRPRCGGCRHRARTLGLGCCKRCARARRCENICVLRGPGTWPSPV